MITASATTVAANAGVTITPMVGYHYSDLDSTNDAQRDVLRTGRDLYTDNQGNPIDVNGKNPDTGATVKHPDNGGISKESSLWTGIALGYDVTDNSQVQLEYARSDAQGEASEYSADKAGKNHFDVEQQMISANALVGLQDFAKNTTDWAVKPYALVGVGQSKIDVEAQKAYKADADNKDYVKAGDNVKAGTLVDSSTDTIGNLGLGAMYDINDNLSLRGEARAIHNFDNNWWEGLATAGLQVALGRAAPAVVAPTAPVVKDKDSDKDGVIDRLDACPGTPMNVVVDARGCPVKKDIVDALKMELRVFFDNDKANIKPQYKPEIAKVAQKMREYPNATAKIEGHASKTGPSAAYNQRLSEARAVAVKAMLANEFGVNPGRIATRGYGYERPIASNDNEEGRAMNRRVYAIITGDKTVAQPKVTKPKMAKPKAK